jgi:hypothetical protein
MHGYVEIVEALVQLGPHDRGHVGGVALRRLGGHGDAHVDVVGTTVVVKTDMHRLIPGAPEALLGVEHGADHAASTEQGDGAEQNDDSNQPAPEDATSGAAPHGRRTRSSRWTTSCTTSSGRSAVRRPASALTWVAG